MGNRPSCPSEQWKQQILDPTQDWGDPVVKLISGDGVSLDIDGNGTDPQPELLQYFKSCDSIDNPALPCPIGNSPKMQGCPDCEFSMYYQTKSYAWDLQDLEAGPKCPYDMDNSFIHGALSTAEIAYAMWWHHLATWMRIQDLCGGVKVKDSTGATVPLEDLLWPHFYHMYNNKWGKCQIDAFLEQYPETPAEAQEALRNNYTDDIQTKYGLLNGYNFYSLPAPPNANWDYSGVVSAQYYCREKGHDFFVNHMKTNLRRLTIAQTNFAGSFFGNPMWNHAQWQEAFRLAIGTDCTGKTLANGKLDTGKDWIDLWAAAYVEMGLLTPGKSADDYFDPANSAGIVNPFTDPAYTGNLPGLASLDGLGSEMIHRVTTDPSGHNYTNECATKDITETLIPYAAGGVVGVTAAMVIPGEMTKLLAFGLGAFTGYELASSVYGYQVYFNEGASEKGKDRAAFALSVGSPLLLTAGLYELNVIPAQFTSTGGKIGLVAVVGGISYMVLYPGVKQLFDVGGDILETALSPVSIATGILHSIFDGCAAHTLNTTLVCKCESSNAKPLMTDALLQDLYGVTGQQLKLRTEAMEAALTSPTWGADPYYMGTCNSDGFMSTPTACLSAGEWAYELWDKTNPDLDAQATAMRNAFAPVVDPTNPSYLPPSDADTKTCGKFGPYARLGGASLNRMGSEGTCYDFRAPGNTADPKQPGPQMELGVATSYDWSKIQSAEQPKNGSCTIL